jgi:hypothetical protein
MDRPSEPPATPPTGQPPARAHARGLRARLARRAAVPRPPFLLYALAVLPGWALGALVGLALAGVALLPAVLAGGLASQLVVELAWPVHARRRIRAAAGAGAPQIPREH